MPARMIDAHHHLFDLETGNYPWLQMDIEIDLFIGDLAPLKKTYLVESLLADAVGSNLEKSVHIQVDWDPSDPVGETRWLQSVADAHGFPHGIVASAHLHADGLEAVLEGHCAFANTRGIRQQVLAHDDPRWNTAERPNMLTLPTWRRGFAQLEKHGLSFDLQIYGHQMADGADLARTFPGTQIVLDHAGLPLLHEEGGWERWESGMRLLAACDNVATKISGLGMVRHDWTVDFIRPIVAATFEIFGVDRCLWGSNFPVDGLYTSYRTVVEAYEQVVADLGLSADEQDAFFYRNAERVYRL